MSRLLKVLAFVATLSLVLALLAFVQHSATAAGLPAVEGIHSALAPGSVVTITILHTNDFHGRLEVSQAEGYPGSARVGKYISDTRALLGANNMVLLDAGDIMQGSLLSNMYRGQSTIDIYNQLGYNAATFGNHEFDWDQQTLISRTQEADFKFVVANLVVNDTGNCATAGWTLPVSFTIQPWMTMTVGTAPDQVILGVIGVASVETPYITKAENTAGLCFKDPADSIVHYYDAVKAAGADTIVVLSHNGYDDGGYGYGIAVYGDKTLAKKLVEAGKPVPLIIGGHSHTDMTSSSVNKPNGDLISGTLVVQANNSGLQVGRATMTVTTGLTPTTAVSWFTNKLTNASPADATIQGWVDAWKTPAYLAKVGETIGYTAVDIKRDRYGDSLMADLVNDALYNEFNTDANPNNDVDLVVNNSGGIRADVNMTNTVSNGTTNVYTLTYGALFDVLPFGNQMVFGTLTGAQLQELLNLSAAACASGCSTGRSIIQGAGIRYTFYAYTDTLPFPVQQPWAWGAYNIQVRNRTSGLYENLVYTETYPVATNEFLAPAGQDGFAAFKYIKSLTYSNEDMLDIADRWISKTFTITSPFSTTLDGRITRNGTGTYNPGDPTQVVPVTVLHHNDSHGNLTKGAYVGYTQLAALINQERARNATRTLLLNGGDQIQGDAMMYYFKSAFTGLAADGTPITMTTNPMMAAMNAMSYTAMTLGNHEFNFGNTIFTGTLKQANFPILQANLYDTGAYGLATVGVQPQITTTVPGPSGDIRIAVLGIGNHRVPNYELPSNIPGLSFTNPITEAQARVPALRAGNDAVIALTHIGFTENPASVEVDTNVDTNLAAQVSGLDTIIGGHSHTPPFYDLVKFGSSNSALGSYKYLPAFVGSPDNTPVLINQAYRYNSYLGEVVLGLLPETGGGYDVVARAGRDIPVCLTTSSTCSVVTAEDPVIKALLQPYVDRLAAYSNLPIGSTRAPIDTRNAYVAETNAANLQADASMFELKSHGINPDFHLSGAMTRPSAPNDLMFPTASVTNPQTMTVGSLFTLMPYENSLVALRMNGPQLKAVLERAYRNYFYYKYVPGQGGYSYYTTCMLDTNSGNQIKYRDTYPFYPNGNNVAALVINGAPIDFLNVTKYYTVSTVNYLAAGSCNFNNSGVSLWPLDPASIVTDTQYYVRDAVIDYVTAQGTITPTIEGRLLFLNKFIYLPIVHK